MPIKKKEWESGRTYETIEGRILSFLQNNQVQAFTESEIIQGIGYRFLRQDIWSLLGNIGAVYVVQGALETLVKEGTVKAKIVQEAVGEETYYMAR